MTKRRKSKSRKRSSPAGFGSTQKLIGNSTKAIVGVTAFAVTANALTEIAKA